MDYSLGTNQIIYVIKCLSQNMTHTEGPWMAATYVFKRHGRGRATDFMWGIGGVSHSYLFIPKEPST